MPNKETEPRNQKIFEAVLRSHKKYGKGNKSYAEIGKLHGLSKVRTSQIFWQEAKKRGFIRPRASV